MKHFSARIFFTALLFCVSGLSAQEARFTPDPHIPAEACQTSVMDADMFARTALIASGTNEQDLPVLLDKMQQLYETLAQKISADAHTDEKAEQSLYFLYTSVIHTYYETQTRIDTALLEGTYNCVSSAVLFMYLMKKEGIPVLAVETPLHAFCAVLSDGRAVDVETTNPWGYDPGTKKSIPQDSLSQTKYITVPAKKYANRHTVDDRRIIALIYNNRMASLQRQKADISTVGLASDAVTLQNKSQDSLTTFYQCAYNAAVDFSYSGNDEQGLSLISQARGLYGDSPLYHEYVSAAVQNLADAAMKKRDYQGALAYLEKYRPQVTVQDYTAMHETVIVNSLNYTVQTKPFEESLAEVRTAQDSLSASNYTSLIEYAYSFEADRISKTGAWLDAASILEQGLAEIPGDGTLVQQRSVYRQNFAVEIHNRATVMYNSGDKAGAKAVIQSGLEKMSDSTVLKNDLRRLQNIQ